MSKRFTPKDNVYQKNTINSDSFDKRRFNELLKMSKGLQRIRKEGTEFPMFDQLMGDMWSGFYKNKPELLTNVDEKLSTNHQLMERLLNDESFHDTHEFTKLDDLHSALNTIGYSDRVFQWIEQMTDTSDDVSEAFSKMQGDESKYGNQSKEHKKSTEEFMKALQKQIANASDTEFSEMLKESVKETKQIEKSIKDLVGGVQAGKGDGELKEIPLSNQFALAEYLKNNHKMKNIAELAGRFKAIARSKQKSMSKESMSRSGVTIGNDIDRILPSEMVSMANPVAKTDFLRRFVEGETLQYATKGKQTLGKGPIILCLDQSGSMLNLDNQSKGFTLALMSIAKRQKRDFALVTFANAGKLNTKQYPKGKISTSEMITMCEFFLDGGTDFKGPLNKSLKLIKGSRFKDADIVFVTDGEANLPTEFLNQFHKEKKALGFSVIGLIIGRKKSNTVSQFADKVHYSNDFHNENAHEIFQI